MEQSHKHTQFSICWSVLQGGRSQHSGKSLLRAEILLKSVLAFLGVMDSKDLSMRSKRGFPASHKDVR